MFSKYTLTILTIAITALFAQGKENPLTEQKHYFRQGEADVESFRPALDRLCVLLDSLANQSNLNSVRVTGSASADGPLSVNRPLAARRGQIVADYLINNSALTTDKVSTVARVGSWNEVCAILENSAADTPFREQIIGAIKAGGAPDSIQTRLKKLGDGEAWQWLAAEILPLQRKTEVQVNGDRGFTTMISHEPAKVVEKEVEPEMLKEAGETTEPECNVVEILEGQLTDAAPADTPHRYLYLKTNIPAWAMLWTNIAVEVDLTKHLSFTLPVYYSGFNYFTGDTKFRTLTLQPELRYWPKADNTGFFVGAHFGLGWYNVAFGGDKRYQDHSRRTPAIGGGVAVGYRFHFCRNPRWQMEASVGAGIYKLDYDIFQNHHNGLIIDRRRRTFYGIDQAAFTISYRFDISRKGGER